MTMTLSRSLRAALVGLSVEEAWAKALQGLAWQDAEVSLWNIPALARLPVVLMSSPKIVLPRFSLKVMAIVALVVPLVVGLGVVWLLSALAGFIAGRGSTDLG